jgi:hypothetical protein
LERSAILPTIDFDPGEEASIWIKIAEIINDLCQLKPHQDISVLKNVDSQELITFATNIVTNYLDKCGIAGMKDD